MVRNLESVDEIQFRTRWKTAANARLKYLVLKTVDEEWMNLLDNIMDELTEHDITEIELNKYIPPLEVKRENQIKHTFSHYLISDNPELLAKNLKNIFQE